LQTAGRVLRPHPDKQIDGALLLDCTGVVERHGSPTDDRSYSLTGKGITRPAAPVSRPAPPRSGVAPRPAPTRAPALLEQALGWLKGWLRSA
jgi:hypothetical protein